MYSLVRQPRSSSWRRSRPQRRAFQPCPERESESGQPVPAVGPGVPRLTKPRASSYYSTWETRGPSFLGGTMESLKLDAASTALILIDLHHGVIAMHASPSAA